MIWKFDVLM